MAMNLELVEKKPGWGRLLLEHARAHKAAAFGLAIALLGVVALALQSVAQLAAGNAPEGVRLALLGGGAGFATTPSRAIARPNAAALCARACSSNRLPQPGFFSTSSRFITFAPLLVTRYALPTR